MRGGRVDRVEIRSELSVSRAEPRPTHLTDLFLCDIALRKVLHVKAVTQCAVLERFSLFLVLSNKV